MRWLAIVGVLATAPAAATADEWKASLEVGGEVDTNVRRIAVTPGGRQNETAPLVRALAELSSGGTLGGRLGDVRWATRMTGGARAVVAGAVVGEDLLIAAADGTMERDLGEDVVGMVRATHYEVF